MNVNQDTMLFENLTDDDAVRLRIVVEELVLTGHIMPDARYFFEVWRTSLGMDDRQGLLLMSTAFPQRALLSILKRR
jgi:hypothetical protein